jgi:hypothetical protein
MRTFEAIEEDKWGQYPALRKIFQTKRLPDSYFGPTSVSGNFFEHLPQTFEIALLVCELI